MSRPLALISDFRKASTKRRKKMFLMMAALHLKSAWEREIQRFYVRFELDLEALSAEKMKTFFRVENHTDFARLIKALDIPEYVKCGNGSKAPGSLALATVLRRLAYPCRWDDCQGLLGRDTTQLSRIYNATINHIYNKKGYLVETFDLPWLTPERIEEYAAAICEVSRCRYGRSILENCQAILGTMRRPSYRTESQLLLYRNSGLPGKIRPPNVICRSRMGIYRRNWTPHMPAWKTTARVLLWTFSKAPHQISEHCNPRRNHINMFGPVLGSRHDCYMMGESELLARLARKNVYWKREYALFGGKGYALSPLVQMPFKGDDLTPEQTEFNLDMSRCRMAVENGIQKICTQFAFGNYAENNKLFWQQCAKSYLVSAVLTNCLTCMYGFSLVERDYNVEPPLLEEYLCCEELAEDN